MGERAEYLAPVEAARRLGVTVKALRLYETHGLVRPHRTSNGWRAYGPEAMARLHQVLALKRLGLPLQRIADLLKGGVGLDAVLGLQEQALAGDRARLDRALDLVRTARRRLAGGVALSIDDLTTLTKETTMPEKMSDEDWGEIFEPLTKKHFTDTDLEALKDRPPFDPQAISDQWASIIGEANGMMARGVDPASPQAMNMARRWKALQDAFTGGDPDLTAKARAMWSEAMADPVAAPRLPMTTELFTFVGKAGEAIKAAG